MATKPRHLKTPLQLWVADNRKRLGLTPADLAALTGVTEDTARGWESRGSPSQDALDILIRRFGVQPPAAISGRVTAQPELAALIDKISELVDLLRPTLETTAESQEGRLRAVEAELKSLRAERASGASRGRSVPDGRAG